MAAVTQLAAPTTAVSSIIHEMTLSIPEILGDTKLEPLEIELRHSRLQKHHASRPPSSRAPLVSSRPLPNPVKPLSPTIAFQDDTPHTKVLDMLRPFCQPVDDFLPGGKLSADLGPVVGRKIHSHQQAHFSPNTSSSPGLTPFANSAHQDHTIPQDAKTNKRPVENSSHHKALSPASKKRKNSTDSHNPRKPRFSSVPAPQVSPLADQNQPNPPSELSQAPARSAKKPSKANRSPPAPATSEKRPRNPTPSSPNIPNSSRSAPKSKPPTEPRSSRASRRRSDRSDGDADREGHVQSRREDRERSSRRHHSESRERLREPVGIRRGRDRDRKRDKETERSLGRENYGRRKRENDLEHREVNGNDGGRSERDSRRSKSEPNSRGRENAESDREMKSPGQQGNQQTNSEGSSKRQISSSHPISSRIARTPPSPLVKSKSAGMGPQGSSETPKKESSESQVSSRKRWRGGAKLGLESVKASQRELHTAFLASKAKCGELFKKKEYDAYEEEARTAFRLGYDFALARETELRLNEQEFRKLSRKDRSHKKHEIISHYKYLTRSFAGPRIKELEEIKRQKSVAFFRRGVQKVYLRIFGLQRLWERDQLKWTTDTQKVLHDALKKNTPGTGGSGKAELSVDVLQRVHSITSDYANMLSILDHVVKDHGEGYEEAGSECFIQ